MQKVLFLNIFQKNISKLSKKYKILKQPLYKNILLALFDNVSIVIIQCVDVEMVYVIESIEIATIHNLIKATHNICKNSIILIFLIPFFPFYTSRPEQSADSKFIMYLYVNICLKELF